MKHTTTNPQKAIAKIESTQDFATKLECLGKCLRDIKSLNLTNKEKNMIQEVYKGL